MTEFRPWPKTARLFRDIIVTEKIDGTNACIQVVSVQPSDSQDGFIAAAHTDAGILGIAAQSRTRLITPEADNFGFAKWVCANAQALGETLGEGIHFGEWWGSGIQRGYGLSKGEKRFSLFNYSRWYDADLTSVAGLGVVPLLYEGVFSQIEIYDAIDSLIDHGSLVSPGFMNPEGVVIYHTASNLTYKVTCKDDEKPKGQA